MNDTYTFDLKNKKCYKAFNDRVVEFTILTYEKNNGKTSFMSYNNAGFTINYGVCK